jgi:hypothetical protein
MYILYMQVHSKFLDLGEPIVYFGMYMYCTEYMYTLYLTIQYIHLGT